MISRLMQLLRTIAYVAVGLGGVAACIYMMFQRLFGWPQGAMLGIGVPLFFAAISPLAGFKVPTWLKGPVMYISLALVTAAVAVHYAPVWLSWVPTHPVTTVIVVSAVAGVFSALVGLWLYFGLCRHDERRDRSLAFYP